MYDAFTLVLMVNHACNLRCSYCYTGAKFQRPMSFALGKSAIDRALLSLDEGGSLELGFFGGEPLAEADLLMELMEYAQSAAGDRGVQVQPLLTTNGTVTTAAAWEVMLDPEVRLTISHDGLPEVHDRHRRTAGGRGTSDAVLDTIRRLLDAGREVRVSMVVRPDTVGEFPAGVSWLRERGVRHFELTLDLWSRWEQAEAESLLEAIVSCAHVWRRSIPEISINWFDEKAIRLTGVATNQTGRCGFGDGQIAVAPSGNLYPCERLIGEDTPGNPSRLEGHATDQGLFLPNFTNPIFYKSCNDCAIQSQCGTSCRCSNYIRTGNVNRPDGLLCLLDKACLRETARALDKRQAAQVTQV